jgi:thiol-disulfide isomerase/thioredoxin
MKLIPYLLCFFFIEACSLRSSRVNPNPEDLLQKVYQKYMDHSSLSYDLEYTARFINMHDTFIREASCALLRNAQDPNFNGQFVCHTGDIMWIYDQQNLYVHTVKDSSTKRYEADSNVSKILIGNIAADYMRTNFLRPENIIKLLDDTSWQITLNLDESTSDHWVIKFDQQDESGYFRKRVKDVFISKRKYVIDEIRYRAYTQESHQFVHWKLDNMRFDSLDVSFFKDRVQEVRNLGKVTTEKYISFFRPDLLDLGSSAPDITFWSVDSTQAFQLDELEDTVVLLDFWYIGCIPCVESIPELKRLQTQYKDAPVKIIGLNPFDYNHKKDHGDHLRQFVSRKQINYTIGVINFESTKNYNVWAYPTIYVINKKGEIAYRAYGHQEDLFQQLDSAISSTLGY